MKNNKIRSFNVKRLKIGAYGMAVTAIVIALVVVLNLVISALPTNLIHLSTGKVDLFEVGKESQKILDKVNEEITAYYIVERGGEDPRVDELLSRYEAACKYVKVKQIDPVENPTFAQKYTTEGLTQNSVIFESVKRFKIVDYSTEIYEKVYASAEDQYYEMLGYSVDTTTYFKGELQFTSAIDYVVRDDLPNVYTLTGHGEYALDDTYKNSIDKENIAMNDLNLLSAEAVPEDCNVLLITLPGNDISTDELDKITAYMADGGDVVLITDIRGYSAEAMPNITKLAETAGMYADEGIVVENDANKYYMSQYLIIPTIAKTENGVTSGMSDTSINTLFNGTQALYAVDDTSAVITPILETSTKAEVMDVDDEGNLVKRDDFETGESISVASVAATECENGETSEFVWYTSSSIVDTNMAQYIGQGNLDLFLSTMNHYCEGTTSIAILGKTLDIDTLVFTDGQRTAWMTVLTIIIPLAFLGSGFAAWFLRRKK